MSEFLNLKSRLQTRLNEVEISETSVVRTPEQAMCFSSWSDFHGYLSQNPENISDIVAVYGGINSQRVILPGVLLVHGGINTGYIAARHIVFGGGINEGIIWAKETFEFRGGIFPNVYVGKEPAAWNPSTQRSLE